MTTILSRTRHSYSPSATCYACWPNNEILPGGCSFINTSAEKVDHPAHYGGDVPHEHWKCMVGSGLVNNGFLYNCTKYIWRLGKKAGADSLEDLKKARWYLDRAIEQLESK